MYSLLPYNTFGIDVSAARYDTFFAYWWWQ